MKEVSSLHPSTLKGTILMGMMSEAISIEMLKAMKSSQIGKIIMETS
jgi:hypothetical protein